MDPLTHFLSGVVLSRAGLGRLCPQASWMIPLAAMAPDADALAGLWGSESYLGWHRQWTHSVAGIPVVAALPVLVAAVRLGRRMRWLGAYAAAVASVALHDLLDTTNAYGVRAWLPFSKEWVRTDIFAIVDLWLWAVWLAAVLGPMLGRLVSSEIGARRGSGRGAAIFALVFLVCYGGVRWLLHQRAVEVLEARLYQGQAPVRVAALPSPGSPLLWRGLVETRDFYAVGEVDLGGEFDPGSARFLHKAGGVAEQASIERAVRATEAFRVFLEFSQYPLWRFVPVDDPEGGLRVEAMDLRFGEPPGRRFVATAVVNAEGRVVRAWFRF